MVMNVVVWIMMVFFYIKKIKFKGMFLVMFYKNEINLEDKCFFVILIISLVGNWY